MTIGVFDSGVGGQAFANAIKKSLPDSNVVLKEDKANLPYGTKTPDQLFSLVLPIIKELERQCDIIVVACNSVSTAIIDKLRTQISKPLIAVEPMVKPAVSATKTGVIAVLATPTTLASERYQWLKSEYAKNITVLEPDCSNWAEMIQHNQSNTNAIRTTTEHIINNGADVIVLGCTHYHWIEEDIKKFAGGRAKVLQPEQPVIDRLKKLIA